MIVGGDWLDVSAEPIALFDTVYMTRRATT